MEAGPEYTSSEGPAKYDNDGDDDSVNDQRGSRNRSRRGAYALQVQRACKEALLEVKRKNLLANVEWAEPLEAAPTAISVMAFLMKTAADKKVAGLEVKSTEVKSEDGNTVLGQLPSKYFHTNLMHCSDVGRLAFLDAQKRMHGINALVEGVMENGGRISYIVELLEDLEDAKANLKPEMEELKTVAEECKQECTEIQHKFVYWHQVINHLSLNALDQQNRKVLEKREVSKSKQDANLDKSRYSSEEQAILDNIEDIKKQIEVVGGRIRKAENELGRLRSLPPLPEPSRYDELRMAQQVVREKEYMPPKRGWISDTLSSLVGPSSAQRREDEEHRDRHYDEQSRREQDIIKQERARRQALRKQANDELNAARDADARLNAEYDKKFNELTTKRDRLAEAQANLAKASADLKMLGRQELELEEILAILQRSTHELGELKAQLGRLVTFFGNLENTISKSTVTEVEAFLQVLERNTKFDGDNVSAIELRAASKKRVLTSALKIQGQFSAINDISGAYVAISDGYIRKAIDKMENLATVDDKQWDAERDKFTEWCKDAVAGIGSITRQTSDDMGPKMDEQLRKLQRRAIEAAEKNEHDE